MTDVQTLSADNKELYIKLYSGVVKHYHDTRNAGKFRNGYSIDDARKVVMRQINSPDGPLISLEDLLLNQNEQCLDIIQKNLSARIKNVLQL